jgi:hypothetical protein
MSKVFFIDVAMQWGMLKKHCDRNIGPLYHAFTHWPTNCSSRSLCTRQIAAKETCLLRASTTTFPIASWYWILKSKLAKKSIHQDCQVNKLGWLERTLKIHYPWLLGIQYPLSNAFMLLKHVLWHIIPIREHDNFFQYYLTFLIQMRKDGLLVPKQHLKLPLRHLYTRVVTRTFSDGWTDGRSDDGRGGVRDLDAL